MRILFVRDAYHLPDVFGGIECNTKSLIGRLKKFGVVSASVSRISGKTPVGLYNRIIRKIYPPSVAWADHFTNHPTYRYWDPVREIGVAVTAFGPNIVVVQGGTENKLVSACLSMGLPVVWYVHGMDFRPPSEPVLPHERLSVIACGQFVADRLLAETGHKADVVRPLIEPADYRVKSSRREVLLINPRVEKGVDTAWALAKARPDIPFRFIQAWFQQPGEHEALVARARQLGNVVIQRSQSDMRSVYARTKILLSPSHSEGHGRSISEAQLNAIPVLGSDRGGQPEAIGPGGVTLFLEGGTEPWLAALSRLWDEPEYYQAMSSAALAHAERTEFTPEQITQDFLTHIKRRLNA